MTPEELLNSFYEDAMSKSSGNKNVVSDISQELKEYLDQIVAKSEDAKAVITVLITSVVYKILHPEQDVRKHQATITGGYAGRTFDHAHITPFMKKMRFPAMAESGWLTRSLEQKVPYDFNYTGAIRPESLKKAFLNILYNIEEKNADPELILDYILQSLIIQRDKNQIKLAVPQNMSINDIIILLDRHFHHQYKCKGASRLPVIALYAVYQCLTNELKRYKDKKLLTLESHTSADRQSGRIGDIDIVNSDGSNFESVEVKFDIPISYNIVEIAKEKIEVTKSSRYYILSTAEISETDVDRIFEVVKQVKNIHGCQLVVNGVKTSLNYYLRLIENPSKFIENYTVLMASDNAVMFEHKMAWNELVGNLT
ncbi:MAG: hypothetical protein MJZ85_02090 [Bacteroidales bacterium]|nr:hypothetical protein [Bacteroidales bacterium]